MKSKIFLALSLLLASTALPLTANAKVDGDSCIGTGLHNSGTFSCATLFPNEKTLKISDIYARGYKVVALHSNGGLVYIVIEKQS